MRFSEAKAPGKLYIAGEYAVVEPGYPAVLIAVSSFLTAAIAESEFEGTLLSKNYAPYPFSWSRNSESVFQIDEKDHPFSYVESAIRTAEKYAAEKGEKLSFYDLTIKSQLDADTGAKIGLGSSAAVTVAVIKALLDFYSLSHSPDLVYKLAVMAHIKVGSNGSFGDLAASSFTGWIAYSSPDRKWLKEEMKKKKLSELTETIWPGLYIEQLTPPDDLQVLIGWTNAPASTTDLVNEVKETKQENETFYDTFLTESKETVLNMIEAFKQNDIRTIFEAVQKNRSLLQEMGKNSGVLIETPLLTELCDTAEEHGAAAKSSGAGGGDCGIALLDKNTKDSKIVSKWKDKGITPLPFSVHTEQD